MIDAIRPATESCAALRPIAPSPDNAPVAAEEPSPEATFSRESSVSLSMRAIRQLPERRQFSNTPDNGEAIPAAAPAEGANLL